MDIKKDDSIVTEDKLKTIEEQIPCKIVNIDGRKYYRLNFNEYNNIEPEVFILVTDITYDECGNINEVTLLSKYTNYYVFKDYTIEYFNNLGKETHLLYTGSYNGVITDEIISMQKLPIIKKEIINDVEFPRMNFEDIKELYPNVYILLANVEFLKDKYDFNNCSYLVISPFRSEDEVLKLKDMYSDYNLKFVREYTGERNIQYYYDKFLN